MITLDTSILIDLEKGNLNTIKKISELENIHPSIPSIPFMSYFEFILGLEYIKQEEKEKSLKFIENFLVIQTTKNTARILVKLKKKYKNKLTDLMIVSQAIEHNLVLVTKDQDFKEIKELKKIIL